MPQRLCWKALWGSRLQAWMRQWWCLCWSRRLFLPRWIHWGQMPDRYYLFFGAGLWCFSAGTTGCFNSSIVRLLLNHPINKQICRKRVLLLSSSIFFIFNCSSNTCGTETCWSIRVSSIASPAKRKTKHEFEDWPGRSIGWCREIRFAFFSIFFSLWIYLAQKLLATSVLFPKGAFVFK